jgi:hypothetical protein
MKKKITGTGTGTGMKKKKTGTGRGWGLFTIHSNKKYIQELLISMHLNSNIEHIILI